MAVAYKTFFRVVVIYKGDILRDEVIRGGGPVVAGIHAGCDLLLPLPSDLPEVTLAEPDVGGGYRLRVATGGREICRGELHRQNGDAEPFAGRDSETVRLEPGDWALAEIVDADDLEVFCQFVRLPVPELPPAPLRPFVRAKETAIILLSNLDQYTAVAAVLLLALLLFGRLHLPHGATLESDRISRRFSAIIRKAPTERRFHKRKAAVKPITRRTVIREARDISRRSSRNTSRSERRAMTRRQVVNPRMNKGALRALNRAMLRSGAVARLFKSQGGALTRVDQELAGLTAGSDTGGGSGGGVVDPLAGRTGGGTGSFGMTAGGAGPRLRGPISAHARLSGRADRRVRVARVGVGSGSVSGNGLTRAAIARIVRIRRGAIKYCYERVLRVNPAVGSGKITVAFKIGPNGHVISARVAASSLAGGAAVGACVTSAIRRWSFPKSDGYSLVRYPFLFSSGLK